MGDKLIHADKVIDWSKFRPIVYGIYDNRSKSGGRPNFDEDIDGQTSGYTNMA